MVVHPLDHARTRRPASRPARRAMARLAALMTLLGTRVRTLSRPLRARVGYAGGVAVASWGVGVQFGLGWALMAGGIATSVSFLLLYQVDVP